MLYLEHITGSEQKAFLLKAENSRSPSLQGTGNAEEDCTLQRSRSISYPFSLFQEGVEVRVARIFNTFGPRMHMNDGRVVSNFILQALQGEPLTVSTAQRLPVTFLHTSKQRVTFFRNLMFPELTYHFHVYLGYLHERKRSMWVEHSAAIALR